MSREEEIKQAAKNRADQYEHPVDWNNCYHHYIQGAEWADQHPREGLVDIDKIASFIKYHAQEFVYISTHSGEAKINEFKLVEAMYKAMED